MAVDAIQIGAPPVEEEPKAVPPPETPSEEGSDTSDLGSIPEGKEITIYGKDNQPVHTSKAYAEQAILAGTHGLDTSYKYNMLSPDGQEYNVPATGIKQALQAGWKLNKTFDAETNQRIQNRINEGGSIGAGLASAADQAASALSLGAYDVAKEKAFTPETTAVEKAVEEGTAEKFPGAVTAGRAIGEGVGLAASVPAFGVAEGVGGLVGRSVVSAGEKAAVEGLTKEAIQATATQALKGSLKGQIANYAAQGAVLAAPQAITEAALGDPKAAGESLLWGTGIGAILGAGAFGVSKAGAAIKTGIAAFGPKADELANQQALKAMGVQKGGAKRLGEEGVQRSAQVLFDEGIIQPGQSFQDMKEALSDLEDKSGSKIGGYLSKFDDVIAENPDLKQFAFNPFNAAMEIEKQLSKGLETPMYSAERAELNKIVDSVAHFTEGEVVEPERPHEAYSAYEKAVKEAEEAHKQTLKDFAQEHIDYYRKTGSEVSSEANVDVADRETAKPRKRAAREEADTLPGGVERPTLPGGEEPPVQGPQDQLGPEPSNAVPKMPETPKPPEVQAYEAAKAKYDSDVINRPISFQKAQEIKQLFSKFPLSKLDPSPKELLQQRARGIVNGMIQDAASKVIDEATRLGKNVDPGMFADYMKQKNIYRATQDIIKYGIENRDAANFGNRSFSITDFISHGKGPVALGAGAVGALVGGVGGAVVGHQLGSAADFLLKHWAENKGLSTSAYYLKKLAKEPANLPFIGPLIAHNGVKALNAHLAQIGDLISTGGKRAAQYGANENIKRLIGGGSGKTKQQQFAELADHIQQVANQPNAIVDHPMATVLSSFAPNVVAEFHKANANAIQYLAAELPKNPNPIPKPFEVNDWLPSTQQMHEFDQKVGAIIDPSSVVKDIANGTATKAQIDALHSVYPTYADLAKTHLAAYGLQNPKKLSEAGKVKMSLFVGQPIGRSMKNLAGYQATYTPAGQQPAQPKRGAGKIKDMPSWNPDSKHSKE